MGSVFERILYFGTGPTKRRIMWMLCFLTGLNLILMSFNARLYDFSSRLGNPYFTVGLLNGILLVWIGWWLFNKRLGF